MLSWYQFRLRRISEQYTLVAPSRDILKPSYVIGLNARDAASSSFERTSISAKAKAPIRVALTTQQTELTDLGIRG